MNTSITRGRGVFGSIAIIALAAAFLSGASSAQASNQQQLGGETKNSVITTDEKVASLNEVNTINASAVNTTAEKGAKCWVTYSLFGKLGFGYQKGVRLHGPSWWKIGGKLITSSGLSNRHVTWHTVSVTGSPGGMKCAAWKLDREWKK